MKHFVVIVTTGTGFPVHTQIISAMTDINKPTIAVQSFETEAAAEAYENEYRKVMGMRPIIRAGCDKKLGQRKPVKCWQTGIVYKSASAAARDHKVTTSAITQHLKDPVSRPMVKGYTFTWV